MASFFQAGGGCFITVIERGLDAKGTLGKKEGARGVIGEGVGLGNGITFDQSLDIHIQAPVTVADGNFGGCAGDLLYSRRAIREAEDLSLIHI